MVGAGQKWQRADRLAAESPIRWLWQSLMCILLPLKKSTTQEGLSKLQLLLGEETWRLEVLSVGFGVWLTSTPVERGPSLGQDLLPTVIVKYFLLGGERKMVFLILTLHHTLCHYACASNSEHPILFTPLSNSALTIMTRPLKTQVESWSNKTTV